MMTKGDLRRQLRMIAAQLDDARQQNGGKHAPFDVQMAVRALMVVVQSIGDVALPDGPAETAERPQDVLRETAKVWEPVGAPAVPAAPVRLVTDEEVRQFAGTLEDSAVAGMLRNAAWTIESLTGAAAVHTREIARLNEQNAKHSHYLSSVHRLAAMIQTLKL